MPGVGDQARYLPLSARSFLLPPLVPLRIIRE